MDIEKSDWRPRDSFEIPGTEIPSWRTSFAVQKGVAENLCVRTWGGIGDQICAEPALRFALGFFKRCRVTLASEIPEIFSHLQFHDVYNTNHETPIWDDYLVFKTNSEAHERNLAYQFFCHNVIQCVDFASQSAFRCQLPVANKNVVLRPLQPSAGAAALKILELGERWCAVHPGKHWQSKTFPAWWWNRVLKSILERGITPVLVGKEVDEGQGTVNVDSTGCLDLRDRCTLNESIWVVQQAPVMVCNDSSPLHMAVSGNAFIGFVATAKHQDFITHWRRNLAGVNEWGWRMQHFNLGGVWDLMDFCPNRQETKTMDKVDPKVLLSWLPEPEVFGPWVEEKVSAYIE